MDAFVTGISLGVSIASALYAGRQAAAARQAVAAARAANANGHRAALHECHARYRAALSAAIAQHQDRIGSLAEGAHARWSDVVDLAGVHDAASPERPRASGILHEASEAVFCALRGQLGWQAAPNVTRRLARIRLIREAPRERGDDAAPTDWERHFESRHRADPDAPLETELWTDPAFRRLVDELERRLEPRRAELLTRVREIVGPLGREHDAASAAMSETARHLEALRRENDLEPFSLAEDPRLDRALRRYIRKLETLSALRLLDASWTRPEAIPRCAPACIELCARLRIIESFESWGWPDASGA